MEDSLALSDEEWAWMRNLRRLGAAGRQLTEHLQCVSIVLKNKSRAECPVQQVALYRRVFCRIYSQSPTCFGLPEPTPRFIAVVNLSGFRAVLHSRRMTLVRLLCMAGPDADPRIMQNVQILVHYAIQHNCALLCCLSLPWQAGVHQIHWELRTLERRPDGGVRDGVRSYSYTHDDIRAVASSGDSDFGTPSHMKAQMVAMERDFVPCDVDACGDNSGDNSGDMSGDASEKMQKMKAILAGMQADRTKMHAQRAELQEAHVSELKEAQREAQERIAKMVDKTQVALAVAKTKEAEIERHCKALQEQNSALEKQNKQMQCEKATQELRYCSERQALASKVGVHELASKAAAEKYSMLKQSVARERAQMEKNHLKQVEDLERRLQEKTIEGRKYERRAEQLVQENSQLDSLVEKMRSEKQALTFDSIATHKTVLQTKLAFGLVAAAHRKMRSKAEASEAALVELMQMQEAERSRLERIEPSEALSLVRETECKEVNTEPQQDATELTDLRAEVGRLNTEKEAWLRTECELRQQLAAGHDDKSMCPSPTSSDHAKRLHGNVRQEVHNNVYNSVVMGASWPQVELGVDQNGDPSMEALVGQLQHSMRAVVDIARAGHKHRHAAENMWSELQALRRISSDGSWQHAGYWQGEMVAVQPPQVMQWPTQAPTNGRGGRRQAPR